ncbi:TPA: hypothetical protein ACGXM3_005228 [Bacillus cereus]
MRKGNLDALEEIRDMIKNIPTEVQNAMFMIGFMSTYETEAVEDEKVATRRLREELKNNINELSFDKLLALYPLIQLLLVSQRHSKTFDREMHLKTKEAYQKGYKDAQKEKGSYEKGFEEGKALRIKELRKMRDW